MWIMICGGPGTGKHLVAEMLEADNYQRIPDVVEDKSEFDIALGRLANQFQASSVAASRDVFTVRSFWESAEIYSKVALKRELISKIEYEHIQKLYNTLLDFLTPPSAIIWMKIDKMSAYDRILLRRKTIDDETFNMIVAAYEEFIPKIRIPVVEVNANEPIEVIKKQVEFGAASLKAARVVEQTLWTRTFFK